MTFVEHLFFINYKLVLVSHLMIKNFDSIEGTALVYFCNVRQILSIVCSLSFCPATDYGVSNLKGHQTTPTARLYL